MPKIKADGREIDNPSWNGAVSRALARPGTKPTTAYERIQAAQQLADGQAVEVGGVRIEPKES